jgi:general secretion pathway protein E
LDIPATLNGLALGLRSLDDSTDSYASRFVDLMLDAAQRAGASDLHLLPSPNGVSVQMRLDGVLQTVGTFSPGRGTDIVTRLKVLAKLLTYRTDFPQEGRIREGDSSIEMRVSSFPTLNGEKVVVRLFPADDHYQYISELGFSSDIEQRLGRLLRETSGAIIIAGPAGSGKTTTLYACLREIVRASASRRSVATLEDPIEVAIAGVAQSQVNEQAGMDLATGLRSLLRQDPEVIAVGEIRDPATAATALQASLTGQLVLTTFHGGTAAGALSRLSDMGIEPYILRSGILAVLCQRLVRRLCDCATTGHSAEGRMGLAVERFREPAGCEKCHQTGYQGRMLLAEMLPIDSGVAEAILARLEARVLEEEGVRAGMMTIWQRAVEAVVAGVTSPAEVRRVLGFSDAISPPIG